MATDFDCNLLATKVDPAWCQSCRYRKTCSDLNPKEKPMARQLESTNTSRSAAATEARKRKIADRRAMAEMLVMVSTEPSADCKTFMRREDVSMVDFLKLKEAGHVVLVATTWSQW